MNLSLGPDRLATYTRTLLGNYLPDGFQAPSDLTALVGIALERVEFCFDQIGRKYYRDSGGTRFDHLNADHMASYLWFLGNSVWRETGNESFSTRVSYLNKIMHGLDLFHFIEMPDIFLLMHPVGTVIGRAAFGDYLVVSQNCTIGAEGTAFPSLGRGVVLNSGSSIIGDCQVGDDVVFGARSFIINTAIPDRTLVLGSYPAHRLIPNQRSARERHFDPVDL